MISHAGILEVGRKDTGSLSAYDCVLRSYAYFRTLAPADHRQARVSLEQAVGQDPNFSPAWASLTWLYIDEHRFGFNLRKELYDPLDRALEVAQHAVALEPYSALAHNALCLAYFYRHDLERFKSEAERALALNPNDTDILAEVGLLLGFTGDWERSIELISKALALNPNPPAWYQLVFFFEHFRKAEYEQALRYALAVQLPAWYWSHAFRAAVHGLLGQQDEARAAVSQLLARRPDFPQCAREVYRKLNLPAALLETFIDGWRAAGLSIPPAA